MMTQSNANDPTNANAPEPGIYTQSVDVPYRLGTLAVKPATYDEVAQMKPSDAGSLKQMMERIDRVSGLKPVPENPAVLDEVDPHAEQMAQTGQPANETIFQIPVDDILSDADFNCRGKLTPLDYLYLIPDLQRNGQLQPIIVQPWHLVPGKQYRIVVGHCRHAAAKHMGWKTIGAVIREYTNGAEALANISENLNRRNLVIGQEAKSVMVLLGMGRTRKQIKEMYNKTPLWVNVRACFSQLPIEIQDEANAGRLTDKELLAVMKMPSISAKYAAVRNFKDKKEKFDRHVEEAHHATEAPKDPPNVMLRRKRVRKTDEARTMKNFIYATFGPGLSTRILAWITGDISSDELFDTLEDYAAMEGIPFTRPKAELQSFSA